MDRAQGRFLTKTNQLLYEIGGNDIIIVNDLIRKTFHISRIYPPGWEVARAEEVWLLIKNYLPTNR
jgi:hypothetical protein